MKRKISFSIALALSVVLVSVMSSDSIVRAETPQRFRAETGLIIPGPHQKVRLTITGFGEDLLRVQFRQVTYSQTECTSGVCKLTVASQTTSNPMTLTPGEVAYQDITTDGGGWTAVRAIVQTNSQNVQVNASIINNITGEVVAIAHTSTTMYWP